MGHDLVDLGDHVREAMGAELPDDITAALRRLSRHYIASRYPDAHAAGAPGSHYGPDDADQAIADAVRVIAETQHAWRQLVDATTEPTDDAQTGPR